MACQLDLPNISRCLTDRKAEEMIFMSLWYIPFMLAWMSSKDSGKRFSSDCEVNISSLFDIARSVDIVSGAAISTDLLRGIFFIEAYNAVINRVQKNS